MRHGSPCSRLGRIPINTRYMLGFEIRLPVIKEALALSPSEQDNWAEEMIRQLGYTPLSYCHMRKLYDGTIHPVGVMVSTYCYRKEAREDKPEWHPACPYQGPVEKKDDGKLPF